jgi:hypothetical protein
MITRETTIEDNLRFAATLEQSHRRHQKRQDRAQVLLTVGVLLVVAFFIAIQPSNDLIENVFLRSQGNQTFKGDLGLISPFAKKKVYLLCTILMTSARIFILTLISASSCLRIVKKVKLECFIISNSISALSGTLDQSHLFLWHAL